MYLVDTNVLSARAPNKTVSQPQLAAWLDRNSRTLFLSAVTVAEIEDGVAKCRRQGATQKADRLAAWLDVVLHLYTARVLPLDVPAARTLADCPIVRAPWATPPASPTWRSRPQPNTMAARC